MYDNICGKMQVRRRVNCLPRSRYSATEAWKIAWPLGPKNPESRVNCAHARHTGYRDTARV